MSSIDPQAPTGSDVVEYDRRNLALYAALLEADDGGHDWRHAAASLMRLNPDCDESAACWRSHLDRARWLLGDGLAAALVAFNERVRW